MKISIVIPSRDRCNNLKGVLAAFSVQNCAKDDFEVIVVDDNSNDETQSIVNEFRTGLHLKYIFSNIPKPHTWDASTVRNLGARAAEISTTAYYFVDSDVVLPPEALANVIEDLEKDSNRVIIGPYDFYQEGNEQVASGDVRRAKFDEVTVDQTFDTIHDGLACFGGNLVIPKDIFWSVGGFDTDVHIGLEDGSMGIKLWKRNTRFSYDKRNWGKHLWHQSPPDRFPPDMADHVNRLNQKHFHMNTSEVDKSIDLITATKETYASWGFPDWVPPESWGMKK